MEFVVEGGAHDVLEAGEYVVPEAVIRRRPLAQVDGDAGARMGVAQGVAALAALQHVVAGAAFQGVVPGGAPQGDPRVAGAQGVPAGRAAHLLEIADAQQSHRGLLPVAVPDIEGDEDRHLGEIEDVTPLAAVQVVGAAVAEDGVVSGLTVDDVGRVPAAEPVVPCAAVEAKGADVHRPQQGVRGGGPVDRGGAAAAETDGLHAGQPDGRTFEASVPQGERHVARKCRQVENVVARSAVDADVQAAQEGVGFEIVITGVAEHTVAVVEENPVDPVATVNDVGPGGAGEQIVARVAPDFVISVAAMDGVIADAPCSRSAPP